MGLYQNLAEYYDLIYSKKDYKKEVEVLEKLIKKYKKNKGKKLLEVACGTGKHLQYLKKNFNCVGTDISKEILQIAKKRNEEIKFIQSDMITLNLKEKFDILTCLFSSIGYVKTYDHLEKTLNNFYKHLNKGGVLLIEPWFQPKDWEEGRIGLEFFEDLNKKIARAYYSKKRGIISFMQMDYLITEKKKGLSHFSEIHEMGLFEVNKFLKIMKKIGFKTKYLKKGTLLGRGLYIGVKK